MHPALARFHPAVASWFADALGAPTEPQLGAWEAIARGEHTLVAAPTGSGKTLAAFLSAIDALVREAELGTLTDETRVLYVSPLKALSNDIEKNLQLPLDGVTERLGRPHGIRVSVRTGDTPSAERARVAKRPPHVMVTTPESLYVLLTSESGRRMLRGVRSVIVDEIHALVPSKRGAHLALSLERLVELVDEHAPARTVQRIGLSATQRPIEEVSRFLVGRHARATIIDSGHRRALDLALELPRSPLESVMAAEVWREVHDRIAELARAHRTTLVFVNSRRMSERLSRALAERLGEDRVRAHHGSLSRQMRLDAERRLKSGDLALLVATSSLELGIDIGAVDLVCQVGSPRSIAAFLQRVGRSGHFLGGLPRGRLFPTSRDDLVECAALLRAVRAGELDAICAPEGSSDVLAQQLVAESSAKEHTLDGLYALARRAYPYRELSRERFDAVVSMLGDGITLRRGRRHALVHLDAVNGVMRGRRGSGLVAMTSGGAIPDNADYAVVVEPEGARVGTVHEDYAIESQPGDVFQLGTTSWRILRVLPGEVRVADASGTPPSIPFWLGEGPGRTKELSHAVGALSRDVEAERDLAPELGAEAAETITEYLRAARISLGALPDERTMVAERFFDEAGNTHLIVHARFGARINRALGLALRKSFCRSFDFELQAAATDDAIILSLGPTHSFPLEDVFRFLHPNTAHAVLVQAVLDAPVFGVRWRWAAQIALAVPRSRGGRKTPPPLLRMQAEDLLSTVFPAANACLENIVGDREVPDHPLVHQALDDCLREALDAPGMLDVVRRIASGEIRCVARDVVEPSPLAAEILGAKPYAFLDDAPLEERRTQAVRMRRFLDASSARDLGALDDDAIARVIAEAWPAPRDADELHEALCSVGAMRDEELARFDATWLAALLERGRATRLDAGVWTATERLHEHLAIHGEDAGRGPGLGSGLGSGSGSGLGSGSGSESESGSGAGSESGSTAGRRVMPLRAIPDRESAARELVRSRLEVSGPVSRAALARAVAIPEDDVAGALAALEAEGFVMRGSFTSGALGEEHCERGLLARIHRATLDRLRREIEPVSASDLMRFFARWQGATPDAKRRHQGTDGLAAVLAKLEGLEIAASAWESDVLPARIDGFDPAWLDALCRSGRYVWLRATVPHGSATGPVRATPIAILARERLDDWAPLLARPETRPSDSAAHVLTALRSLGAPFVRDLIQATRLAQPEIELALGELVALGLASSDSWGGLRALLGDALLGEAARAPSRREPSRGPSDVELAGRWYALTITPPTEPLARERAVESYARTLLDRWGVVVRRVVEREPLAPPWGELVRALRRLEARGEIRGGRFVALLSGEQFALPDAITLMRELRREARRGDAVTLSGADPLNLSGVLVPGPRVPSVAAHRVVLVDGVPIAAQQAGELRSLATPTLTEAHA